MIRSRWGSSTARSPRSSAGSSIQASGKPLGDPPVEIGVRRVVDGGAVVGALEIDDVDVPARGELGDELVRPAGGRVELEAQRRVELEPALEDGRARRGDERSGLASRPTASPSERPACAQREVERRGLEGPAAVVAVGVPGGLAGREEIERVEARRERRRASRAGELEPRQAVRLVLGRVVGDVLAESLDAAAAQLDESVVLRVNCGEIATAAIS